MKGKVHARVRNNSLELQSPPSINGSLSEASEAVEELSSGTQNGQQVSYLNSQQVSNPSANDVGTELQQPLLQSIEQPL